jgi:hypothetical protein
MGLGDLMEDEEQVWILRSDTLCVMAEIVQTAMIGLLSRAYSVSCTIGEATQKYPILTCENLRHELVFELLNFKKGFVPKHDDQEFVFEATELLNEPDRTSIIHCFSRSAGIVRIANNAYDLIWATFVNITLSLLGPGCRELMEVNEKGSGKRVLALNESPRSTPPLSKPVFCLDCGYPHAYIHTPVPCQIENAAKALGLSYKVYGFDTDIYSMNSDTALASQLERDYEYSDRTVDNNDPHEMDLNFEEAGVVMSDESDADSSDENGYESESSNDGSHDELLGDVILETHNEVDMDLEDLSDSVDSASNGVVGDVIEDPLGDGDEYVRTTRNGHHCVIS